MPWVDSRRKEKRQGLRNFPEKQTDVSCEQKISEILWHVGSRYPY